MGVKEGKVICWERGCGGEKESTSSDSRWGSKLQQSVKDQKTTGRKRREKRDTWSPDLGGPNTRSAHKTPE